MTSTLGPESSVERDVVLLDHFSDFQEAAALLWRVRGKKFEDVCSFIDENGDSVLMAIDGDDSRINMPKELVPIIAEIVTDFNEDVGGIYGVKRPEDFAIPEDYLFKLFALDDTRPKFVLEAIALFYDITRLQNDQGVING